MAKHLKIFFCLFFVVSFNDHAVAQVQAFYRDVTIKESLISVLYQYGKEIYYRGVDPQAASFAFQRILVLDCGNQGAKSFLDKIRLKYPEVSIKIHGCSEVNTRNLETDDASKQEDLETATEYGHVKSLESMNEIQSEKDDSGTKENFFQGALSSSEVSNESQDYDELRKSYQELQDDLSRLEGEIRDQDSMIFDYQQQLSGGKDDQEISYATIAQDQKDLIRVQQGNIDFLKTELAEAQKHTKIASGKDEDEKYGAMHREIADINLTAQEKAMALVSKDNEAKTLRGQLEDLEEQLRLVQEIVNQKNSMIQSLQEELKINNTNDKK